MGARPEPRHVRGDDLLPTFEAVALAKAFAARACAERAAAAMWVSRDQAHTWLHRTPTLALAVLQRLCPEVALERLASCLGLDPTRADRRMKSISAPCSPPWPPELIEVVAQQIVGAP